MWASSASPGVTIDDIWTKRLEEPGALPALPAALVRLQQGLCDLNIDIDQLSGELQRDPPLVSRILKTINSPLFGLGRPVDSVKGAVLLLGLQRVRAIILCQSLRQSLTTYSSPGFSAFAWWDRSLINAVSAATLCQRTTPKLAEEAYLAGLMADLGILVLGRFEATYERRLRNFADRPCRDLCQPEVDAFGVDHAELGAAIFRKWSMPDPVVDAVANHHNTAVVADDTTPLISRATYFGCLLTDCVVSGREELCGELRELAGAHFGMDPTELGEFVTQCLGRYRSLAQELGRGQLADRGLPEPLAKPV